MKRDIQDAASTTAAARHWPVGAGPIYGNADTPDPSGTTPLRTVTRLDTTAITAWTAANEAARDAYHDHLDRLPCGRCGRRDTDTHTCNEGDAA